MNNLTYLIGRLVRTPEIKQISEDKKVTNITIAVPRNYKNINGDYEMDFFDCVLWNGVAESTSNYCKKGDLIGVKGRLQSKIKEFADGSKINIIEVVAEKISFLSNSKADE